MMRSRFGSISLLPPALLISLLLHAAPASAQPRQIQQLNTDWRFLQSDAPDAQSLAFDDSAWQTVTLPHDGSIAGPVKEDAPSRAAGGFFPTGIAWYRRTLTLQKPDPT